MQERMRAMEDRRRVAAQAAFEADLLRDWREQRRRSAHRSYVTGGSSREAATEMATETATETAAEVTMHGPDNRIADAIREHRLQWVAFEKLYESLRAVGQSASHSASHLTGNCSSHELVHDDVPWIPDGVTERDYLMCVARAEHQGDVKKAYAAMCLTWHPDKFQNRYMGFFGGGDGDEWGRVVARVNETFARFMEAFSEYAYM